ncbi:MAG: Z1 domain-containing protein [Pseudomonadota bacterium]
MSDIDKTLEDVISIAQRLVGRAEKDKSKITSTLIEEKVKAASAVVSPENPDAIDQAAATAELIRRFSHWIGKVATLKDVTGHVDWLVASRKKDRHYWRRYRDYMEAKLAMEVVDALDESTDDILALLEDPKREGVWNRRGLVVGHVQSGKTGNYSGLICKAADAGYKIIIVLAGMHNNLRSQTQVRLEESFLGYETTANRDPGKPIGVAAFGGDLQTHSATTRADNGDFNETIANHFAAISPEERPWLFVVKKNKSVLKQLLKWIRNRVANATDTTDGHKIVSNLPLLMIDDEADNASVDTGEQLFNEDGTPDEEHEPKAINSLIRQLLHSFSKKAYVGYTATPFANIFIHRKGSTKKEGPDLFPESFILNLAAPSNYVGPARIFGRMTKEGRKGGLPLTRTIEDHFSEELLTGWMPPKHKKEHVPTHAGQEMLPPSLVEAICSFALACAVRQCRGQGSQHSSMLIHVTRFVNVQGEVRRQVDESVKRMRQRLSRKVDHEELEAHLKCIWERDFVPTSASVAALAPEVGGPPMMPSWSDVLEALPDVLEDIDVRSINGTAKDALDYAADGAPLKIIAIGGDKLARGLTLEGLCTSYFIRTTKMYDTLMQMGRWFGYRPGYVDVCRLYTTADLVGWFGHIADASEELREEFDTMVERKGTPSDYGLKVQSHPVLTVTSPLKMRNSESLKLSYSGTMVQTVALPRDTKDLQINLDATDRLLTSLGSPTVNGPKQDRTGPPDHWNRSSLWLNVDAEMVLDFLGNYVTHLRATSAKSSVLAEFIEKMNEVGELRQWTVGLLAEGFAGKPHKFSNGVEISTFPSRSDTNVAGRYSIGVLTDPSDEAIDVGFDPWNAALQLTKAAWKPDPARNRIIEPTRPSGKKIREMRGSSGGDLGRGVLLLYPLSPLNSDKAPIIDGWDDPIIAFAMAFPTSETGIKVEYKVDLLYWEQEYGPSE